MKELLRSTIKKFSSLAKHKRTLFVLPIALLGAVTILFGHAQGTSTITGSIYNDSNRNRIFDTTETPLTFQVLLFNSAGINVASTATDSTGTYKFSGLSDGDYTVALDSNNWWQMRDNWVFTTIPYSADGGENARQTVSLTGSATVNFGLRQIVRSTDPTKPLTTFTQSNGMVCSSYNDVLTAQDWCDAFKLGSLTSGQEAATQKLYFDSPGQTATDESTSYGGRDPGPYCCMTSTTWLSLSAWYGGYGGGSGTLWHEYGHAWGIYNAVITQQDSTMSAYLKARGISGDPRLYSGKTWDPSEILAEDYRLLFGSQSAANQNYPHANTDIPDPRTVSGLKDWLQNTFTKPPGTTIAAPSNLNAKIVSQSQIDLSWSSVSGASEYKVYRDGSLAGTTSSLSTVFSDVNLSPDSSHSYYVKAVSSSGQLSSASATITAKTLPSDTSSPSAPGSLTSTNKTANSIYLQWNASTDNVGVTKYLVYQVSSGRNSSVDTLVGSTTNTNFTVTGLRSGTSYSYYIIAVDAAGNQSTPSNTLTVKTLRK